MDEVFRALADPSRRRLLDRLNERNGQSLRELCAGLGMARQSVSKHLGVLANANLVTTVRRGREKLHYLNAEPINAITRRWIHRYDRDRVTALADLKSALEEPMTSFVYTTYIRTTPELLWRGLTEPEFTRRYWGGLELVSDWRVGSPVLLRDAPGQEAKDLGQVVLEADPYRRLAYSWHHYQPEHAELFGWSAERLAELRQEPRTRAAFDLADLGDGRMRLTVTHDGFAGETDMYRAVSGALDRSGGWPMLVADLKSLLEAATAARAR